MVCKEGTKILTLRIPEELKFQIELEAYNQGRSVNNFLTFIIKKYIEEQKK